MRKGYHIAAVAAAWLFVASSCGTPKDVTYFQDVAETILPVQASEPIRIEPGDKLSIVVKSKDPALSDLFNLGVTTNRIGSGFVTEGVSYYTVSQAGTIDFPVMGQLKIAGMTKDEVNAFIKGELIGRDLVKDPIVTTELVNATYSVLGEVNRPGEKGISTNDLTILQAIAQAGDLSIMGRRDNIKVMRQEADGLHTYNIDMTNLQSVAKSPAYYVQQGDVIYVEPNDVRKRQATVNGNNLLSWGFWVSVASLVTSIAVLIVK